MNCSYYYRFHTLLCLCLTSHWLPLPLVGDRKHRTCELDDTLAFMTEASGLLKSYSTAKGPLLCYSVGGGCILAKNVEDFFFLVALLLKSFPFFHFISPVFLSHPVYIFIFFLFAFFTRSMCFFFFCIILFAFLFSFEEKLDGATNLS